MRIHVTATYYDFGVHDFFTSGEVDFGSALQNYRHVLLLWKICITALEEVEYCCLENLAEAFDKDTLEVVFVVDWLAMRILAYLGMLGLMKKFSQGYISIVMSPSNSHLTSL